MGYLKHHHMLSSRDIDEYRESLTALFGPNRIGLTRRDSRLDASISAAAIGDLVLINSDGGRDVVMEIDTRESAPQDTLMLNFLTSGSILLEQGGKTQYVTPEHGIVCDDRTPFAGKYQDYSALILSIPIDKLQSHACRHYGESAAAKALQYDPHIDMTTTSGQYLHEAVLFAARALDGPLRNLDNSIALGHLQDTLLSCVLAMQPNAYMDLSRGRSVATPLPYHVKRARDYIHAHAAQRISADDLANAAGCAYRTLQTGFRNTLDMSPMAYLKTVRLDRIRQALLESNGSMTVAQVAQAWGFINMGNFANDYQKRFGERPSDTLRLRR